MLFALVDDQRTPPSRGLKGSCPACGAAMIAKCGNLRVHHWAHHGERVCDPWWEETEWHRVWKNRFPAAWQEVIRCNGLDKKHIADVHTPHGLTIEFQHSALKHEERIAREKFYGNMLWVVDGSRLERDLPRFLSLRRSFRALKKGLHVTPFPEEAFPRSWINSTVPVFFDFQNATGLSEESMYLTRSLVCLLPGRAFGQAVVLEVSREDFMRSIHDNLHPALSRTILESVARYLFGEHQKRVHEANLRAAAIAARQRRGWRPRGFRRPLRRL